MISIASSPNTERSDLFLAFKLLLQPWRWLSGKLIGALEVEFRRMYGVPYAYSFESGRVAMYAILKGLGIGEGDEVAIQAFTCVVVPDAVLWTGAKPLYIDIDETYNLDPKDLAKEITPHTKAVVVQHTFGVPADLEKIKKIAEEKNLYLIEDCAHTIDPTVGIFGDAVFFSFGQEKVISSVRGGMAVTANHKLGQYLERYQASLLYPLQRVVFLRLLHPLLWALINKTYYFLNFGKGLLVIFRRLGFLSFLVSQRELSGGKPQHFPRRFPNALAALALFQLSRLEKFNERRKAAGKIYARALRGLRGLKIHPSGGVAPFLRYTVRVKDPQKIFQAGKKKHIIFGNWYDNVIYPKETDLSALGYEKGSCPKAEKASQEVVNLPSYPKLSDKDIERVVKVVREALGA